MGKSSGGGSNPAMTSATRMQEDIFNMVKPMMNLGVEQGMQFLPSFTPAQDPSRGFNVSANPIFNQIGSILGGQMPGGGGQAPPGGQWGSSASPGWGPYQVPRETQMPGGGGQPGLPPGGGTPTPQAGPSPSADLYELFNTQMGVAPNELAFGRDHWAHGGNTADQLRVDTLMNTISGPGYYNLPPEQQQALRQMRLDMQTGQGDQGAPGLLDAIRNQAYTPYAQDVNRQTLLDAFKPGGGGPISEKPTGPTSFGTGTGFPTDTGGTPPWLADSPYAALRAKDPYSSLISDRPYDALAANNPYQALAANRGYENIAADDPYTRTPWDTGLYQHVQGLMDRTVQPIYEQAMPGARRTVEDQYSRARENLMGSTPAGGALLSAMAGLERDRATGIGDVERSIRMEDISRQDVVDRERAGALSGLATDMFKTGVSRGDDFRKLEVGRQDLLGQAGIQRDDQLRQSEIMRNDLLNQMSIQRDDAMAQGDIQRADQLNANMANLANNLYNQQSTQHREDVNRYYGMLTGMPMQSVSGLTNLAGQQAAANANTNAGKSSAFGGIGTGMGSIIAAMK